MDGFLMAVVSIPSGYCFMNECSTGTRSSALCDGRCMLTVVLSGKVLRT